MRSNSNKYINSLLIFLTLLLISSTVFFTTSAARDTYKHASSNGLDNAAWAYSLLFANFIGDPATPEDRDSLGESAQRFLSQLGDEAYSSLVKYDVYIFSKKGDQIQISQILMPSSKTPGVNRKLRSSNEKENTTKEEKLLNAQIDSQIWFNSSKSLSLESEFTIDEIELLSFWNHLVFNPNKHYKAVPMRYKGFPTGQGMLITRKMDLLENGARLIIGDIKKYSIYFMLIAALCLILASTILRSTNLLIKKDLTRKNLESIEKGWRKFSHDVDTPILNIKNSANKLAKTKGGGKQSQIILNACDRIENYLNDQRVDSRGGDTRSQLTTVESVSIKSLLYEVVKCSATKNRAHRNGCKINLSIEDDSLIKLEKNSIMRAITNIVNNAIDFTRDGSVDIIVITVQGFIEIKFLDTGIGVTEKVTHNFGSGVSEPRPGTEDAGQGLGLLIVEKIIQAHKGELVWPRNRVDQRGSEVVIRLPLNCDKNKEVD